MKNLKQLNSVKEIQLQLKSKYTSNTDNKDTNNEPKKNKSTMYDPKVERYDPSKCN